MHIRIDLLFIHIPLLLLSLVMHLLYYHLEKVPLPNWSHKVDLPLHTSHHLHRKKISALKKTRKKRVFNVDLACLI